MVEAHFQIQDVVAKFTTSYLDLSFTNVWLMFMYSISTEIQ